MMYLARSTFMGTKYRAINVPSISPSEQMPK
jgi:hypothetical protein